MLLEFVSMSYFSNSNFLQAETISGSFHLFLFSLSHAAEVRVIALLPPNGIPLPTSSWTLPAGVLLHLVSLD